MPTTTETVEARGVQLRPQDSTRSLQASLVLIPAPIPPCMATREYPECTTRVSPCPVPTIPTPCLTTGVTIPTHLLPLLLQQVFHHLGHMVIT